MKSRTAARALFPPTLWLLAVLPFGCTTEPAGRLIVSDARVRALIPGQDKTAAYFEVTNRSREPLVLVGAESPAARAIEIHSSSQNGDVLRMRRLREVRIEPGATIGFQPGGHHLMLFGVRSLDDETEIRLLTETGEGVYVSFRRVPIKG